MSDHQSPHQLELRYGLSAVELLEALERRFRARVTLEGAVAEVHLAKHAEAAINTGAIRTFEVHDIDGHPDISLILNSGERLLMECKNVRNSNEAYRRNGQVVAYKVETQKTRASQGDSHSRYYGFEQFDILAVCLGKKTGNWREFAFIRTRNLTAHRLLPSKLAVMQRVPLGAAECVTPWSGSLTELIKSW